VCAAVFPEEPFPIAQERRLKTCPVRTGALARAAQYGQWRLSAIVLESVGQELGQRDGPGQRCAVEVAGFAPAQQLFAVGDP
jgi:hypothetical protein